MPSIQEDSGYRVIEDGIKVDIANAIENKRYRAALILIYSAMDSMAFLDLPAGKIDVHAKHFISWASRYVRFPCKEQVTGEDLYGARCAMLHTSRVVSTLSRQGACRLLGYCDHAVPEIRFQPHISNALVIVSVVGLKNALFSGINKFLIHAYADKAKAAIVNSRIEEMVQYFPIERDSSTAV